MVIAVIGLTVSVAAFDVTLPHAPITTTSVYAANADLVLNGHEHIYERYGPQDPSAKADAARGIVEILNGTGGAGFYGLVTPKQPNSQFSLNNLHGISKITLKPNGWDSEFVPSGGGASLDKSSGTCH